MTLSLKQFQSLGGLARKKKYSKEQLSKWGRKGGRPKGIKVDKSTIPR